MEEVTTMNRNIFDIFIFNQMANEVILNHKVLHDLRNILFHFSQVNNIVFVKGTNT